MQTLPQFPPVKVTKASKPRYPQLKKRIIWQIGALLSDQAPKASYTDKSGNTKSFKREWFTQYLLKNSATCFPQTKPQKEKFLAMKQLADGSILIIPKCTDDIYRLFKLPFFNKKQKAVQDFCEKFLSTQDDSGKENKRKHCLGCGGQGIARIALIIKEADLSKKTPPFQFVVIKSSKDDVETSALNQYYQRETVTGEFLKECLEQNSSQITYFSSIRPSKNKNSNKISPKIIEVIEERKAISSAVKIEPQNLRIQLPLKACLVMPYLPSIKNLKNSDISIESLMFLANQCFKNLIYLEQKQLVHADIKPDNIFFNPQNGSLIFGDLDFIRAANPEDCNTYNTLIELTEGYISPENQLGKPDRHPYDRDTFATGLSLLHLIFPSFFEETYKFIDFYSTQLRRLEQKTEHKSTLNKINELFKYISNTCFSSRKRNLSDHFQNHFQTLLTKLFILFEQVSLNGISEEDAQKQFKSLLEFPFKQFYVLLKIYIEDSTQKYSAYPKIKDNIIAFMTHLLINRQPASTFQWPYPDAIADTCPQNLYKSLGIHPDLMMFLQAPSD